jgi:Ca-activated chloride channel homolog
MNFGHPLLLLTLLVLPLAWLGWRAASRRRMRYAVRFTNVEVLAGVVGMPSRLRFVAPALIALALATLCVAVARPHVAGLAPSDKGAVILVLDVSGSMQAEDVKPTRLAAAQRAIHIFLDKVPDRVRVGLILFAGTPVVATPPTTDHDLVGRAVDSAGDVNPFGGTAIGDALAAAVRLGREVAGTAKGQQALGAARTLAAETQTTAPRSPVTILFLSDGHQNRGNLQPLQGAARAKAAGFPVYTVALGTTGNTTLRGRPSNGGGFFFGGGGGFSGANGLAPDPTTLHAIATTTGGKFFRAKTAGDVQAAYSRLGATLGRAPERVEVTVDFVGGAVLLVLLAGLASMFWAPRVP